MLRETIVNEVKKILHGPIGGNGELIDKNPLDFYSVGVLFPQITKAGELFDTAPETISEIDGEDSSKAEVEVTTDDENAVRRRLSQELDESDSSGELELAMKFRPSAVGISVLVTKKSSLKLSISFGTYLKTEVDKVINSAKESKTIKVTAYKHEINEFQFESKSEKNDFGDLEVNVQGNIISVELNEKARMTIVTRPYPLVDSLEIKTITLINKSTSSTFKDQKKAQDCIFQPNISITIDKGFHSFDDNTDLKLLTEEDINLKLLYRNYKTYALGHGISTNWDSVDGRVTTVFTQVLPEEKVNGVDLNPEIFNNSRVLFIKRLSGKSINDNYDWDMVKNELIEFINLYKTWINDQYSTINKNHLDQELVDKAKNNLQHCEKLYSRMKKGIELLSSKSDSIPLKAFEDANRAMFIQRVLADFSKHRRKEKRVQHNDAICDDKLPDYTKIPYDAASGLIWKTGLLNINPNNYEKAGTLAKWRPFQLAFLLSQIEGIVNPTSDDRDTVDLIWFPTGGGKTEAYLALTAFTIFYRRLNAKKVHGNPDKGAGVSVLMRYTLRLLNKQQFERASILICSCDLIRRMEPSNYGVLRISNGIWMGRSMTSNNEKDQKDDYEDYIKQINKGKSPNAFKNSPPLLSCPCCGNRLVKEFENNQVCGRWGYFREKNSRNSETGRFLMACTNTRCDFHVKADTLSQNREKLLPIFEVDETIYGERPSLIFSTVDKFVQLAWKSECFHLFNIEFSNNQINRLYPSPDLIIQDELHLISSALGTIYGVYEIVIDKLCTQIGGNKSKVVGATATVRNAEEQCRRLYGRSHFLQFPPPATDADDSFYSRKIVGSDPKSRLYVGFMPSGVTTSTALIRLAAVLLERIPSILQPNENLDNYYTLVVYFNALKELGKFRTFLTDDIVAYRKLLANHFNTFIKPFNNDTLCELSTISIKS